MEIVSKTKEYKRLHYLKNKEKYIKKAKEWKTTHRSRVRELTNAKRDEDREAFREKAKNWKTIDGSKKYRIKYPDRYEAYKLFYNALRRGMIKKVDECQLCKSTKKLEAHHIDYSQPFDVVWLCALCHGRTRRYEGATTQ